MIEVNGINCFLALKDSRFKTAALNNYNTFIEDNPYCSTCKMEYEMECRLNYEQDQEENAFQDLMRMLTK